MIHFTTIVVALMRGVLIKGMMGSKHEEEHMSICDKTKIYVTNRFKDLKDNHPLPWNLLFLVIQRVKFVWEYLKIIKSQKRGNQFIEESVDLVI